MEESIQFTVGKTSRKKIVVLTVLLFDVECTVVDCEVCVVMTLVPVRIVIVEVRVELRVEVVVNVDVLAVDVDVTGTMK